jgi:signal transduction histidine kinase
VALVVSWARAPRIVVGWLRTLRQDLAPSAGAPLLPLRSPSQRLSWLAWLPHALVVVYGVVLAAVSTVSLTGQAGQQLVRSVDESGWLSGVLGLALLVALVLCLYRPLAGWWLALAAAVATAVLARSTTGGPLWTEPSLLAYLGALVLVGLRVRPRVLVELWLLTLAAGTVLALVLPGPDVSPDLPEIAGLSATVLLLAGTARVAIEARRRLRVQEHVSAAERAQRALLEERARIARELHDVVAHHLSVIAIQAEAAPYRVPDPPEALTRSFVTIRGNAREALTELRRLLGLLRAGASSEEAGPQPTLAGLDDLVANVRGAGLAVTTAIHGTRRALPPGVELSAYRILQEALSNALRHAPGADVRIDVAYQPTELALRVVNGPPQQRPAVPLSPSPNPSPSSSPGPDHGPPGHGPGHGLLGMRERAAMLGGELTAGPQPDGGYAVAAVLPVGDGGDGGDGGNEGVVP